MAEKTDLSRIDTTLGNYHLQSIIGRGGMGTVYRAEHVYIKKTFAVKVLHQRYAKYQEAITRFLREARAASAINHPNIVDVSDFGPANDGGVYFVMEFIEGESLEDIIEKQKFVTLHRALNITNQMALALIAAHDKGVIHRDLKPENIMVSKRPGRRDVIRIEPQAPDGYIVEKEKDYDYIKLLDFGIAKILTPDELEGGHAAPGAVFGTPEYMSPEAAQGKAVDFRTDIYSLGVILFDMLCGRPPFEAEDAADVLEMQINKNAPIPSEYAPAREISTAADRLILRALSKNPDRRQQSMIEFRNELQHCYGSIAYRRTGLETLPPLGPENRTRSLTEELDEWLHNGQPSLSHEDAVKLAEDKQGDDLEAVS